MGIWRTGQEPGEGLMITKTFENVKEDVSKDFQTKKFRIAVRPVSTVRHIDITDQVIFVLNL